MEKVIPNCTFEAEVLKRVLILYLLLSLIVRWACMTGGRMPVKRRRSMFPVREGPDSNEIVLIAIVFVNC